MDIDIFTKFFNRVPFDAGNMNVLQCAKCAEDGNTTCCETYPCYISPDDVIDKSFQGICRLIDTGLVSLDWWEGNPLYFDKEEFEGPNAKPKFRGYFLRMRVQHAPIVHPTFFGGKCVLYDNMLKCLLPYGYRPKGGRELLPPHCKNNPNDNCREMYNKQTCAVDWMKYHNVLCMVYDKYCKDLTGAILTDDMKLELGVSALLSLEDFLGYKIGYKEDCNEENREDTDIH